MFVVLVLLLCCSPIIGLVAYLKYKDYKDSKSYGPSYTPGNYSEWHNLPASEVFGDSNALEETKKKWHSKPLTF